jgi:competence protein ComEC
LLAAYDLCPLWVAATLLALGVVAAFIPTRYLSRTVSVVLCFLALGAVLHGLRHVDPLGDALSRAVQNEPAVLWTLEGRVENPSLFLEEDDFGRFVLRVDRVTVNGEARVLNGGVSVGWTDPGFALLADERVRIHGDLSLALSRANPGLQDAEDYLRRHGVHSAMRLRGARAVERVGTARTTSPYYWASRLRRAQAVRLAKAVPDSTLPFVHAVWLGARGEMTREEYEAFTFSGTAHILAVSGLHTGIVYASVFFLLRITVRNRRVRVLLTMAAVLLFTLMAGARVATLRAAIMVLLYLASELFDREPDAPSALSFAGVLFLIANPDHLFDRGFQLSFSSVASILLFSDQFRDGLSRLPWGLREGLSTTLAVQILPLPLAIRFFHVLPWMAPLANLVVVPLLTVTLWLAFMTSVCAFLAPPVATLTGHALVPVVWLIKVIVNSIASQAWSHFTLTSPSVLATLLYLALVYVLFRVVRHRKYRGPVITVAAVLVVVIALTWQSPRRESEVVFLDVGQGDATFIRTATGHTVLIDGGDRSEYTDMGARVVVPYLLSAGVKHLDYVVFTHPDRDHIGGLFKVLERFSVGTVVTGAIPTERELETEFLAACETRGVPVSRISQGERIPLGNSSLTALHPGANWPAGDDVNNLSLVLTLDLEGVKVLLPGDIEAEAERALADQDCRAAILKAPHHGSQTSSTQAFINSVGAEHGIVSAGGARARSIVSRTALDRYAPARIWRTDRAGAVRVRVHDGTYTITGERALRGYPSVPSL